MALGWLNEFISYGKEKMLPLVPELLSSIIPSLSYSVSDIKSAAILTNTSLLQLIETTNSPHLLPLDRIISTLLIQLLNKFEQSRIASLNWILILHKKVILIIFIIFLIFYFLFIIFHF